MWPSSIPLWPLLRTSLHHLHTPPFTTFAFTSNTIASYCSTSIVCRNSTFDEPGGTYTVKVVTCIWSLFLPWFLSESELAREIGCARRTTCLVFTSQINLNKKHKDIIKKWKDTSLQMSNSRDVFMFKLPLPFLLFLDDSDGTPKEVDQPGETTHIVKVSNKDSFL